MPNNVDLRLTVGDVMVDNNCLLPEQFWDSFPVIAKDIEQVVIALDTINELRWRFCLDGHLKIQVFF